MTRWQLLLYAVAAVAVVLLGARYLRHAPSASPGPAADAPASAVGSAGGEAASARTPVEVEDARPRTVTVHVAGAVRRPGVYRLRRGARVDDAVRRAGGVTRIADLAAVNLAAEVEDGRQVLVPERAGAGPAGSAAGTAAAGSASAATRPGAAGGGAAGATPGVPVNLNTATLEQLDALPGVGPVTAQKILDYRAVHGGFGTVDELAEVPGIGEKRLAALRDLLGV